MKLKMIEQALNAIVYMLCIIVTGIFIPTIVSLIASISDSVTFTDCFNSQFYWIFSVVGVFVSIGYYEMINDKTK